MVVDYERAWTRLQAEIASKSQHGRADLLTTMATIAGESQVPEGEAARWLRLFGIDVSRAVRPQQSPDTGASSGADAVGSGIALDRATLAQQGGHDGAATSSRNGQAVAA